MSTPVQRPPPVQRPGPGPIAPPDQQFWQKYSPHYEFPLSSVGSVALHIAALVVFLGALWLLARMTISDKTPVPMSTVTVMGGETDTGSGNSGSGGGREEDIRPFELPMDPKLVVPDTSIEDIKHDNPSLLPKVEPSPYAPSVDTLPALNNLSKLDEDLRKKLLEGKNKKKGTSEGEGSGHAADPGTGSGPEGDAKSSQNRAIRWVLLFNVLRGRDYLNQIAALDGILLIPQPPNGRAVKAYRNLADARPKGEEVNFDELPGLFFVNVTENSPALVAEALGLDFVPSKIVTMYPKEMEEMLAAKERAYRGRKESEIFSTTFKVVMRDGTPTVMVIEQVPVRR